MFQIDKETFGLFVATLRKEKGMTQKELAQCLSISDKAVSKWETGNSLPDIALLPPLAEKLGVSVSELLEGRRLAADESMDPQRADTLVQKALSLSKEERDLRQRTLRRQWLLYGLGLVLAVGEILLLLSLGHSVEQMENTVFLVQGLGAVFGFYFIHMGKKPLPAFYEENEINYVNQGFFQLNLPGVVLNNSNWPHILKVGLFSSLLDLTLFPLLYLGIQHWLPQVWAVGQLPITLLFLFGALFPPMCWMAKKYS